ncbi:STM4015 family protein [Actinorugispora endophytica]|uniref:Leucine rich repeat (LRR) protein n=1 Tax=Actinorugispora endophytica TaxID=1605990 RepID=A0A4R6V4X1_9ACTN|nr:STM4015 family protein [Actinorugispora endophytica]TDQ53786.1 hypothetical protein EV190_103237 [Actinorugispora endophytica]
MINEHITEFADLPVVDFPSADLEAERLRDLRYRARREGMPEPEEPGPDEALDAALADPGSAAWRLRVSSYDPREPFEEYLARFLAEVDTAEVGALVIGCWGDTAEKTLGGRVRDALLARADRFPALRSLFFGEFLSEEAEISWIRQTDVTPLLEGFPSLEEFTVRGGTGLGFHPVRHGGLRGLVVQTGGLPKEVTAGILASDLPALEYLELWLGVGHYGGDTSTGTLAPLLSGAALPELCHLGLRDAERTDDLVRALADAPVLEGLRSLDLSMGTLTDTGARAVADSPAFRGLSRLDLSHHFLSRDRAATLPSALPGVEVVLDDWRGESTPDKPSHYPSVTE